MAFQCADRDSCGHGAGGTRLSRPSVERRCCACAVLAKTDGTTTPGIPSYATIGLCQGAEKELNNRALISRPPSFHVQLVYVILYCAITCNRHEPTINRCRTIKPKRPNVLFNPALNPTHGLFMRRKATKGHVVPMQGERFADRHDNNPVHGATFIVRTHVNHRFPLYRALLKSPSLIVKPREESRHLRLVANFATHIEVIN